MVRLRIKSRTKGDGQVFWGRRFHRGQRVTFRMTHDGEWHECEARLPGRGPIERLRIDPGSGAGPVEIDWIRLVGPDGGTLKAWEF